MTPPWAWRPTFWRSSPPGLITVTELWLMEGWRGTSRHSVFLFVIIYFISAYQLNYRSVQRCCCCFFINSTHIYLYRKFSLDDVLTNVMIYWTTGSIVSSMRFYKENFKSNPDNRVDAKYVAKCSYGRDHDLFYKMDNPIIQSHCDNVSSLF